MAKDNVVILDFLDGGIIRATTEGAITDPAAHFEAEKLLKGIERDAGKAFKVTQLKKGKATSHTHTAADGTQHTHQH